MCNKGPELPLTPGEGDPSESAWWLLAGSTHHLHCGCLHLAWPVCEYCSSPNPYCLPKQLRYKKVW